MHQSLKPATETVDLGYEHALEADPGELPYGAVRAVAADHVPRRHPLHPAIVAAMLLAGLTEPATTTVLAHRHALAAGTVSEHLTVLREAGLVVGQRHRHEIRYRRTPLGSALLGGST